MTASIILNRLIILKSGKRVYDQVFHNGLNIICGSNGSGKTSIADLIFYSLGGDLRRWKKHALSCDEVIAEYNLSGVVVTLQREIQEKALRPMKVFFGPMEKAIKSVGDGWVLANFARDRGGKRSSFSQLLFKTIGLPELPGDGGGNITMHQILRLMYVDQTSPFQKIFRAEPIGRDPKDTKEAVAELLCGIGGFELYSLRLQYRQKKVSFDAAAVKYSSLSRATMAFDQNFNMEAMEAEVAVAQQNINTLNTELESLETSDIDESAIARSAASERRSLFSSMSKLRAGIIDFEKLEESLVLEVQDSIAFVAHLQELLSELTNSASAFVTLGAIAFAHCPACFSSLKKTDAEHCNLCGNDLSSEEREAKAMQVRLDIEGQIKESQIIQTERLAELTGLRSNLRGSRTKFTRMTKQLDDLSRMPVDGRSAMVSQISRKMGALEARLIELEKLKQIAEDLSRLAKEKNLLNGELLELEDKIEALENSKNSRRRKVLTAISESTKFFLRKDMEEHTDFESLDDFAFSFEDDWFAVNGDPNISTSASGMVMIKNCLMLGLLKSSIEDPLMKFPKFLIQDNGEDKGMVGDRIRHFQAMMAEWSNSQKASHQIILTTSTLNPDLDSDIYLIGPKYTKENRTLDFSSPPDHIVNVINGDEEE